MALEIAAGMDALLHDVEGIRVHPAQNILQGVDLILGQADTEHLHLVAAIDDLKYLRKGGRLPAAVAVAGGMLGIKPLITIKDGKVAMAGKARGLPGAYVALFKKIEELGGISPDFAAVAGYSSSLREVQPIENYFRENLHMGEPLVRQIGCVIGTHAGPGAFGLAFFDKELVLE